MTNITAVDSTINKSAETLPFNIDRFIGKFVRTTGISRGGLLIISILILVIIFLIIKVSKTSGRFETAKKKMEPIKKDTGNDLEKELDDIQDDFDEGDNGR